MNGDFFDRNIPRVYSVCIDGVKVVLCCLVHRRFRSLFTVPGLPLRIEIWQVFIR